MRDVPSPDPCVSTVGTHLPSRYPGFVAPPHRHTTHGCGPAPDSHRLPLSGSYSSSVSNCPRTVPRSCLDSQDARSQRDGEAGVRRSGELEPDRSLRLLAALAKPSDCVRGRLGNGARVQRRRQDLDTIDEPGAGPREERACIDSKDGPCRCELLSMKQRRSLHCGRLDVIATGHEDDGVGSSGGDLGPGHSDGRDPTSSEHRLAPGEFNHSRDPMAAVEGWVGPLERKCPRPFPLRNGINDGSNSPRSRSTNEVARTAVPVTAPTSITQASTSSSDPGSIERTSA